MNKLCNCPRWLTLAGIIVLLFGAILGYVGWDRFMRDHGAQTFETPDERFKYGSIGAEFDAGIPYWIFYVLPRVFPDKLPGPGGYAALGVAWEQGQELPVGFTKRRIGFDRVANNCASCHTASVRTKHEENPVFYATGPNHRLDLEAFFRFLPLLNFEWVMVRDGGSQRLGVKGGRSPAERTLDAWNRAIRWSVAGCSGVVHPAMETRAAIAEANAQVRCALL